MSEFVGIHIYEYSSVDEFLRAVYEAKKKVRPTYSIRGWSKKLNAGHNSTLARVISGEQKIPQPLVKALIKDLKLSKAACAYFEILALTNGKISDESLAILREALSAKDQ